MLNRQFGTRWNAIHRIVALLSVIRSKANFSPRVTMEKHAFHRVPPFVFSSKTAIDTFSSFSKNKRNRP